VNRERDISRRGFLTRGIRHAFDAAIDAARAQTERVAPPVHLRPPGAAAEPLFLALCTRCGDCVPACPDGAIRLLPSSAGAAAASPVLTPRRQPCRMCHDAPCIAACAPAALVRGTAEALPAVGTALVDAERCWSALGQECDYCARECRRHVDAIALRPRAAPEIDSERCDGCGRCEYICPVQGASAIKVVPKGGQE